jgi:hydroxymethylglutaryl-CoA lyase
MSQPRVYINEVVTRDGFQMEQVFVPTQGKISLLNRLGQCGFAKIEVTSFTSPKAIPMLRDAELVMAGIERVAGVVYTVLVPNLRGAERALDVGADEMNLVMSVSEAHNQSNLQMGREASFEALSKVIAFAGRKVPITVSLSCSFGCPIQGAVPIAEVLSWAGKFIELGVAGITLCDTTGMAHPVQVAQLAQAVLTLNRSPDFEWTMHFHNTRGMGLANTLSAVQHGIVRFDSAMGGLGGCPYAPGATGNICTEDTVHMLEAMGLNTGVSLERLLGVARELPALVGHDVPGQIIKAGRITDLHPMECV